MIRSSYTPAQIADAVSHAKTATGWPDDMLIHDMAAHILAGPQASDEATADAADQVLAHLARQHVEGRADA
ncbi:hypothetical protein PARHAE_00717 [Paracoccus haematequi]|uniref:Uncharacterized protein n=1 Tax=Paracoccus haematequi TaxID=2491866 RepID=A0A3S4CGV6_9RHOB|nr:hypothetical protein [Paracoccus haematequi]VDS07540.1 hypothetical protein PARHAE_00717 [Paracoccus haematequi]